MARRIPTCMTGAGFPDESPVAPRWTGLAGTSGAAAARNLCPQVVPTARTPATLKKSRRVPDVSMSALRLIISGMLPLRLRGTEQSATLSCARASEPQRRDHSSRQSPAPSVIGNTGSSHPETYLVSCRSREQSEESQLWGCSSSPGSSRGFWPVERTATGHPSVARVLSASWQARIFRTKGTRGAE